jgi:hypothetical protein
MSSSSSSINPTIGTITNRSTLSRESILEARQRRRRRIQKQKHLQVQHLHQEIQKSTAIPKTPLATNNNTSLPTMRSQQSRFPNTSIVSVPSKELLRGMTTSSMDNILEDGNSFVLISDDDNDNKSTQSMMDNEIDAFILPLDYTSSNTCYYIDDIHNGHDDHEYDPYLVPISMIQKKTGEQYHYIENNELVTSNKNMMNMKENIVSHTVVVPVDDSIQPPPQRQQPKREGSPPKSGGTLLNKASKIIRDRRPVPYVCIPTPISVMQHESDTVTAPITDRKDDSCSSNDSRNNLDSIVTIDKLLDGIHVLPHNSPPQTTSTSMSIVEQFQHEQQGLKHKYEHQPPSFLLLLSHMYGNAYLHQNHDIEGAKLWFEYANEQSKKSNSESVAVVDPLDRSEVHQRRPRQQQQPPNSTKKNENTTSCIRSNIRKQPDNRLQQSLYRIERLQRWYYEENPDVDENLLFEL